MSWLKITLPLQPVSFKLKVSLNGSLHRLRPVTPSRVNHCNLKPKSFRPAKVSEEENPPIAILMDMLINGSLSSRHTHQ
jgi:hypothetical protein